MPDANLEAQLADIREFIRLFKNGDRDESVEGFRCLLDRVLRLTILDDRSYVRTVTNREDADSPRILAGPDGVEDPLLLNNGYYLRLIVDVAWDGTRLQVAESTFQYQVDQAGSNWLFRYDFLRNRPNEKPEAHLHISGKLDESFELPENRWTLKDVHFPTAKRVSVESVIRLLADDFQIPCNNQDELDLGDDKKEHLWRAVLRESERAGFF